MDRVGVGPPVRSAAADRSVFVVTSVEARTYLADYLEQRGFSVTRESRIPAAIVRYEREQPSVLLLDLLACGDTPLQWLAQFRALGASTVALVTPGVPITAAEVLRHGAASALLEPIDLPLLEAVVRQAGEHTQQRRQAAFMRNHQESLPILEVLAGSAPFVELMQRVRVLAASQDTTVLLTGEDGTGKHVFARLIHELSPRRTALFAYVSCPPHTPGLGSELFGHEPGVRSQADRRQYGTFEVATGGTVFLDGLGGLGPELQSRLLHVLESKTVRRLGGHEVVVDTRCIVATSANLEEEVRAGRLREDLYNRISIVPLHVPAFRELPVEDRQRILSQMLDHLTHAQSGKRMVVRDGAMEALLEYNWPGNLSELRNVLERALLLRGKGEEIGLRHLPVEIRGERRVDDEQGPALSLATVERQHIVRTLTTHGGNRSAAARDLGIARATLIKKIRRYGLDA